MCGLTPPLPNSMRASTEASTWHSIPDNHLVRIPCSLEIADSFRHICQGLCTWRNNMTVSGQVRMNIWELLCDCLPAGDLRREASTERVSGVSFLPWRLQPRPALWSETQHDSAPMGDAADQQVYQIAHSRIHNVRAQGYQQRSGQCQNVILPCSTFRRGGLWLEITRR